MNIYFVRHGESDGNHNSYHQGEDVALSNDGIKQAKLVANNLKNLEIDVIYASPYLRARQTAEIISKELNMPIEYWNKIVERKRPSEIVGKKWDDPVAIKINSIVEKKRVIANWKYSDDESFIDLVKRAKSIERYLLRKHSNQNVLCISHQGIMKMIMLHIILQEKLTPEVFWQFYYHSWIDNTGISHLRNTSRFGWELVGWNDTTHNN